LVLVVYTWVPADFISNEIRDELLSFLTVTVSKALYFMATMLTLASSCRFHRNQNSIEVSLKNAPGNWKNFAIATRTFLTL